MPAGLAFLASSLKITTSLPFLLLPFDRRSWRVLLVFGVGVAALSLCLYPPGQLLGMGRNHLANVAAAREVGEINDYSYEGPYHDDMLGLEHWLYCLGMRDAQGHLRLAARNPGRHRAGPLLGLPGPCQAAR